MHKMWATLVHLTLNMWERKDNCMHWDHDSWRKLIDECVKYRINTIVLDVADGLQYKTHPEIAVDGAWSHEKMREEIALCKEKGITLIPKLNFSSVHDQWLGEYHHMLSTGIYYQVCRDLIREVAELFDHPKYFHLGMDEEDHNHAITEDLVIYRQKELLFHDLRFLCDCVKEAGATPWVWHDNLFFTPKEFKAHISPDEVIISPWHYYAFREDHFTPVTKNEMIYNYYSTGEFAKMNLSYVEEDPFFITFHRQAIPNAQYGYRYVPCASLCFTCEWNHRDLMEYFQQNAPDGSILGYMTAPWRVATDQQLEMYIQSFKSLDEARRIFCPNE